MMMTMIPAELLCNKHLAKEHDTLHELALDIAKYKIDLAGSILAGKVEPMHIAFRHDELAREMLERGLIHFSPLEQPVISYMPMTQQIATVDYKRWSRKLTAICDDCKELHRKLRNA